MFHLSTTMYGQRVESSSLRSNSDSSRFSPARVSLPHNICRTRFEPEPTYINPHILPKHEPVCAVLHLPVPLLVETRDGYTLLSPSPHSQCVVVFFYKGIAKISGLLEYVASTTRSQPHIGLNEWSLIDTNGTSMTSKNLSTHPLETYHVFRPVSNYKISY
jgi:hypothetical protein